MPTTPQGMNSQEELERCLHFIVKAAKNHYSDVSPVMSPGDAKWADELPKLIEAEACRRELALLEELLAVDKSVPPEDWAYKTFLLMEVKRQSLKEKEAK